MGAASVWPGLIFSVLKFSSWHCRYPMNPATLCLKDVKRGAA